LIGVAVRVESIFGDSHASSIHFVRLDDPEASGAIIESNYVNGSYVYLLEPPPGRYAIVASEVYSAGSAGTHGDIHMGGSNPGTPGTASSTNTYYFSQALVDETAVTVREGDVVFVGEIVLDGFDWAAADETQQRYYDRLAPGHRQQSRLRKFLSSDGHHAPIEHELARADGAWRRFLTHTRNTFTEMGWGPHLADPVAAGPSDE
jgi:PAS domain-containing protein